MIRSLRGGGLVRARAAGDDPGAAHAPIRAARGRTARWDRGSLSWSFIMWTMRALCG